MTDDTAEILAALDVAIEALNDCTFDDDGVPLESSWARKCKIAHAIVSYLRSRIEKERPFLEAAMDLAKLSDFNYVGEPEEIQTAYQNDYAAAHQNLVGAYRALVSEKLPEEGAK